MKLCPYCSKTLTDHALACKHCGEWLEDISDYLKEKGSIYADTDSMVIPPENISDSKITYSQKKNSVCVFCDFPINLNETETKEKSFICPECGKKNIITGRNIDDILRNIPVGWGWILLAACFTIAIQKYLTILDDILQMIVTFLVSIVFMLYTYFLSRRIILKERYVKKKFLGNIYNASLMSGIISTVGVVILIFCIHMVYPYTGLLSDKQETNSKIKYFSSKLFSISEKQKEITEIISKPVSGKSEAAKNLNLLDGYIKLNNEEKLYTDSIYKILGESDYYTGINDNNRKIREASLLMNKIITYKNMSAQNLKHYYLTGNENAYNAVEELNSEIAKLNKEYSSKYQDLILEE